VASVTAREKPGPRERSFGPSTDVRCGVEALTDPTAGRREGAVSARFENVVVVKKANVYFDGKCVSHTVLFPDGARKTIGVILPSKLTFETSSPEVVEINEGRCRVRLKGETGWREYAPGERFEAPGNSSFEIETLETLDYVCHFG
jgi:uncharacterized protein YaiE (UPF0345 family)